MREAEYDYITLHVVFDHIAMQMPTCITLYSDRRCSETYFSVLIEALYCLGDSCDNSDILTMIQIFVNMIPLKLRLPVYEEGLRIKYEDALSVSTSKL